MDVCSPLNNIHTLIWLPTCANFLSQLWVLIVTEIFFSAVKLHLCSTKWQQKRWIITSMSRLWWVYFMRAEESLSPEPRKKRTRKQLLCGSKPNFAIMSSVWSSGPGPKDSHCSEGGLHSKQLMDKESYLLFCVSLAVLRGCIYTSEASNHIGYSWSAIGEWEHQHSVTNTRSMKQSWFIFPG